MCMIDDIEISTVLSSMTHKARKEHQCIECGRAISKGETYRKDVLVDPDGLTMYRTCAHCMVVREWLIRECSGWVYTMTNEDLNDHCRGGGNQPMSVYRLNVSQRHKWRTQKGSLMRVPVIPASNGVSHND